MEAHELQFLRNAVEGREWAKERLHRALATDGTLQELYSEVYASLEAHESAVRARRMSFPSETSSYTKTSTPDVGRLLSIMFNGKRRY